MGPMKLNGRKICSLVYADDMLILSYSESGPQKALNVLEEYCGRWQLVVNIIKTKVLIFNKKKIDCRIIYMYKDATLETVDTYTYLGILIHTSGSFMPAIKYVYVRALRLKYVISSHNLDLKITLSLFDSLVKPSVIVPGLQTEK